MVYGTVAAVEIIAYGQSNTDEDTRATQCLTTMTAYINAYLNRTTDISSPSSGITQAANMMAAAMMTTAPENMTNNVWWQQGLILLELAKGDSETDAPWGFSIPVLRE